MAWWIWLIIAYVLIGCILAVIIYHTAKGSGVELFAVFVIPLWLPVALIGIFSWMIAGD